MRCSWAHAPDPEACEAGHRPDIGSLAVLGHDISSRLFVHFTRLSGGPCLRRYRRMSGIPRTGGATSLSFP